MKITEIRIKIFNSGRVRGFADITFDNELALHGLAVVDGNKGYFISMPSKPDKKHEGEFLEIAHPVTPRFRRYLEEEVLHAYEEKLAEEGEK